MATRLFEEKDHIALYQQFRFSPQQNLLGVIFSYLERKKTNSFQLAVDVGCGSGQSTLVLAKRFEKVVGTDISAAQIKEAKRASHPPNVDYFLCPAEALPFKDSSVDLITAFNAAHWFDAPRFLREVDRVLTPAGCVAVSSYNLEAEVHYKDCSEKLTEIFMELREQFFAYADEKIQRVMNGYKEIFDSLLYQDKKRFIDIVDKVPFSIAGLMGYVESLAMYQTFLKAQPEVAKALLQNTEKRFLEAMGVSSRDTTVELWMKHICILGCKNP
ncbi:putative methyltransferase DDB_G0268948 [Elgaria multicarinata webbii]|uniref:putative methyltransferase DDB_G0268948 n=1 Tax=Elgaria multicarinata webbii TaxID=159646 RepID=UPI002FCCE5BA